MWEKIKKVIIGVLAAFGVLFLVLMILPEDEEEEIYSEHQSARLQNEEDEKDEKESIASEEREDEEVQTLAGGSREQGKEELSDDQDADDPFLSIPEELITDQKVEFKTVTLDGEKADDDIFSDYDLTVVYIWGTYCSPCRAEMGEVAEYAKDLPENVNLVSVITDVYDGVNTNVEDAKDILSDGGAQFMSLRTSDSLYDVTSEIRTLPTCFFVNRSGYIVGEIMDGAGVKDAARVLSKFMD